MTLLVRDDPVVCRQPAFIVLVIAERAGRRTRRRLWAEVGLEIRVCRFLNRCRL
ncbi:hypothetical protein U3938_09760 [Escherichia coli]|uniref:hypothetical protein n=1 Tax=Escherichia coli TaxID=562 RepID=UPI002D765087|nr:hypothetical protein [Escherichia coli]WRQ37946.1 hypothetical protein U3938_09760 [Escherichia coli]